VTVRRPEVRDGHALAPEPARFERSAEVVAALRRTFADEGLHIVRPLSRASFGRAGAEALVEAALPGAGGAVIVGDGGAAFFARFQSASAPPSSVGRAAEPDPLDRYTAEVTGRAAARALAPLGVAYRIVHPFDAGERPWPFQRLGLAAGLPGPGPLALQVHPTYGPWWAYRALVVVGVELAEAAPLSAPCDGCAAPCVSACPGGAVRTAGFAAAACVEARLARSACQLDCAARRACVVGREHAYGAAQLAFHMGASLRMLRRR
jgi:ferredoxin